MKSKLKYFLYGLGVFAVYAILSYILRLIFNKMPDDAAYFGVYTANDLLIGVIVSALLTFSHARKNMMK